MATPEDAKVLMAVQRYVDATKGWPRSDYRIEINRREGDVIIACVIHKDDEVTPIPGGGRSFEVHLDVTRMEVVKELGFQ